MAQNNKLIEKLDSIDYTHLLGYPSEVVAAEIMSMVKDVVSEYMDNVVEQLEVEAWEFETFGCKDTWVIDLPEAIEIVKGGAE